MLNENGLPGIVLMEGSPGKALTSLAGQVLSFLALRSVGVTDG